MKDLSMHLYRITKILLPLLLLSACATFIKPPLDYHTGAVVETLSSAVSLSIYTADGSMGGSGYLVFRRPDQLHLVVLSPFGTTILEAFALGDLLTLVYPSRSTAYVGRFDELPDKGGLQGWRLLRWVMDADPLTATSAGETVERISKLGLSEQVTYEHGLVVSKVSPAGDHAYYSRYSVVNGVPVATELDLRNGRDDRIRIILNEPEINAPLDDLVFTPRLDGLTIMPLSAIQGL
jgi:hypothetical protein